MRPIENARTCNFGGGHQYPTFPGPAIYRAPCGATPTHRYRTPGTAEGHWSYRCGPHAAWLDTTLCTIEPLTSVAGMQALEW